MTVPAHIPPAEQEPVSQILQEFIDSHPEPEIPLSVIVHAFGSRGMAFLLLVFALICALPLPIPGIHMFLSLPLFYIGFHQMIGRQEVWLPKRVLDYKLPRSAFTEISLKAIPWIRRVEKVSKIRWAWMTEGFSYCFFGTVILFITAVLSVPLFLTNFVPAIAISLMALGMLMKDGLAIVAGMLLGILWSIFLFFIYFGLLVALIHQTMAFLGY
jgi:hypothetical protein